MAPTRAGFRKFGGVLSVEVIRPHFVSLLLN
ncbi:hypothetical protein NSE_0457 [Neorickettsia sennetsu str. Miyayama]|uniref:Uncharacterized protein n=1 Tax=Ehrlichia sennetsu (strain ATCC VR-367 / Miyayama) TaxID=222891 RepID=Q2GDV4_EHRS3|nr:hypothetical protein NSE_0457 [Neorickettsia sennetsu str. Miyayama]